MIARSYIESAREIACAAHAHRKYGVDPYSVHLEAVDAVLCEFGHTENQELRAAAWLHDVIEDTDVTAWTLLSHGMPVYVASLVDAVTNQPGKNRAERNLKTYPRIARMPDAVTLKLADRLANVRASVERRPDLLRMYAGEYKEFAEAMPFKAEDEEMWLELGLRLTHVD